MQLLHPSNIVEDEDSGFHVLRVWYFEWLSVFIKWLVKTSNQSQIYLVYLKWVPNVLFVSY